MKLSPAVFSISYCCAYALAFRFNFPLGRYYPIAHEWAWGAKDAVVRQGPPMVWYGLVATAILIAVAVTVLVRDKLSLSRLRGWLWVFPWLAAGYCVFLLRLFFL